MPNKDNWSHHLQLLWDENFPLAKAMGLTVVAYEDHVLTTRTPLALNTNIHNTAFAGSLYAAQAMTCWCLLHLELATLDIDASIIHADGQINFASTINQDIICQADFTGHESCLLEIQSQGRTKMTLKAAALVDGAPASEFSGTYLARLAR